VCRYAFLVFIHVWNLGVRQYRLRYREMDSEGALGIPDGLQWSCTLRIRIFVN
jgi:hypothetical protein